MLLAPDDLERRRLPRAFYARPTLAVARDLLGQIVVHLAPSGLRAARIVETEAYVGQEDRASHAHRGPAGRAAIMFGPPGYAYIYRIYGRHDCLNVVTEIAGVPGAILLRAAEPLAGILGRTSGPGLLCRALGIDRTFNGMDLTAGPLFVAAGAPVPAAEAAQTPRIGVDSAGEWAARPWRFIVRSSPSLSRPYRGPGGGGEPGLARRPPPPSPQVKGAEAAAGQERQERAMDQTLRAGVIGLRRGMNFVRLLQAMDGVAVVAVADLDPARVESACRQYAVPRGCAGLDDLLDVGLDFLVVATPPALHVPHSVAALDRGIHVLSEVPALAAPEEAETLIAAVERSKKQYMLAENCCYWAFVATARELHARGEFGTVFYAEAEYIHNIPQLRRDAQGRPTWRAALEPITYITHSLGPIMWITGQYPVETSCYGTSGHFEPQVTDVQVAIFRMTEGSVVRITCCFANAHWGHHRLVLFGTRASLDTGSVGIDEPKFWSPAWPNLTGPLRLPVGTSVPRAPQAAALGGHGTAEWFMVGDFIQAVRAGTRPPIDVYDAVMYSLPGLCARDSARSGRPVAIPQYQHRRPGPQHPHGFT